jgi:hypothetical protein
MQMNKQSDILKFWIMVLLIAGGVSAAAQEPNAPAAFSQEQLEQMLAPIALYPDSLLSQILMASTYPLEVVQAQRWVTQNSELKGDAMAKALEEKSWDPSVKSLTSFPDVLDMMNDRLDWTQNLGDAFLSQQKDVMNTVQKLRKKAEDTGNLKTTEQQVVKTEQQVIIIEQANPEVIYVPTYNPTVVYGPWPYPAYPPYYWYPPVYTTPPIYAFGVGLALGAAWGYAWGHCDWHGGDIDVDFDRNVDFNRNIDRDRYKRNYQNRGGRFNQNGQGRWQHNPADRRGVPYRDQATAQRYNRASEAKAVQAREAYRGRAELGRQEIARGGQGLSAYQRPNTGQRPGAGQGQGAAQRPSTMQRPSTPQGPIASQRPTIQTPSTPQRPSTPQMPSTPQRSPGRDFSSSNRGGAFQGMSAGSAARVSSNRGQMSRQTMSSGRSFGGGGGGMRGGGRGGGGRR